MTPILLGRWQSRIVLMGLFGSLVTILFGWSIGDLTTPFFILGYVLILGLLFDIAYDTIQKKRWDRDWPPLLHFASGVVEGAAIWMLIQLALLPGVSDTLSFDVFLVHYGLVWAAVFAILWGPMKVFFPSWRFDGGLVMSTTYSIRRSTARKSGAERLVTKRKLIYAAAAVGIAVLAIGGANLLMDGFLFVGVPSGADLASEGPELWIDNPADGGRVPVGEAVAIRWRAFQPVNLASFDVIVNGHTFASVANTSATRPFAQEEYLWYPPDTNSYDIEVIARDILGEPVRTATASVTAHTPKPLFAGVDVDHTIKNPMYVQVVPAFPIQKVEVCRRVTLRWTTDWRGDDYSMRVWSVDKPGVGFSRYNATDPFFSVMLEPDATYQWTVWSNKVEVPVSEDSRVIETFHTTNDAFCPDWKNDRVRAANLASEPTGQSALQIERFNLLRGESSGTPFPTGLAIGGVLLLVAAAMVAYPSAVQVRSRPAAPPRPIDRDLREIIMVDKLARFNQRLDIPALLFVFWAVFWLLNAGDAVFNGTNAPNTVDSARAAAITTESGEIEDFRQPIENQGFFGVDRNTEMINNFAQLSLPAWSALLVLYSVAVLELLLGAAFTVLAVRKFSAIQGKAGTLLGIAELPHLAFKCSALMFIVFTAGAILLGTHARLWRHGMYFVVVLVSYYLFTQHQKEQVAQSVENKSG